VGKINFNNSSNQLKISFSKGREAGTKIINNNNQIKFFLIKSTTIFNKKINTTKATNQWIEAGKRFKNCDQRE
jgi:hypothetical protein